MGFCPECKYEYESNIEKCADCGSELVEKLEKKKEFVDEMDIYPLDAESKMEELFIANSEEEANGIISLLEFNGIRSYKSSIGAGSYMTIVQGFSTEGIRIWVLDSDLDDAREVLNSKIDDVHIDTIEYDAEKENLQKEKDKNVSFYEAERAFRLRRRRRTQLVLFIFFGLPILFILGFNLLDRLMNI